MSKRKLTADAQPAPDQTAGPALAPWQKGALSLLLSLHVLAVFAAPFAFACRFGGTSSPLANALHGALRPYIGAMFLEHGYFFFAPNPGETHAVHYRVEFDDGRPAVEGEFPDLAEQQPRLLYHRHFMLAEELTSRFAPPAPPPEPAPPPLTASDEEKIRFQDMRRDYAAARERWQQARRTYVAMQTSIENHLKTAYGGQRVTLSRVEYRPLMPNEKRVFGWTVKEPALRSVLPETLPPDEERRP